MASTIFPNQEIRHPLVRRVACIALCGIFCLAPAFVHAQQSDDAHALVRSIVDNELKMDANDHSRWMYRDVNGTGAKKTVKLVIDTPDGSLSKLIETGGHPLTARQRQADERRMHRFVTDPQVRQKQKRNSEQDDKRATSLTKMLPDAFLWKKIAEHGDDTTLAFQPNPKFNPPTRAARVFAAMKGTMVVNTKQKRIQSLQGTLIRNVDFGWGLLGKMEKGGTFRVERREIGPGVWEITQTHVHIHGHALIFKSISEQQDEETSDYKPAPQSITLAEAAKMLNDGTVAKDLGVDQPK